MLSIVKRSTDIWKSLNKQKFRLRESSAILGVIQNSLKKCNYLIDFTTLGLKEQDNILGKLKSSVF